MNELNNKQLNAKNNDSQSELPESKERRELISKLGKFAVYAAPFTVLAVNSQAASGSGTRGAALHGSGR